MTLGMLFLVLFILYLNISGFIEIKKESIPSGMGIVIFFIDGMLFGLFILFKYGDKIWNLLSLKVF